MKSGKTINIRIIGLGGMGILKSSHILSEILFRAGFDVKRAEVHGMSQRGGSVTSDIRFGKKIFSPMIPDGEVDFLLVIAPGELDMQCTNLRPGGMLINAQSFDNVILSDRRSLNVAMLGILSRNLNIPEIAWNQAIKDLFPAKLHDVNLEAFKIGRNLDA